MCVSEETAELGDTAARDPQEAAPVGGMSSEPNKAEWMSALSTVVSAGALVLIALVSFSLQREVKDLTFPAPELNFKIPPVIGAIRETGLGDYSVHQEIATTLTISGKSTQAVIVSSVSITRADSEGEIELDWPEDHSIVSSPSEGDQIDAIEQLKPSLDYDIYGVDRVQPVQMEFPITFRIAWYEGGNLTDHEEFLDSTILIHW